MARRRTPRELAEAMSRGKINRQFLGTRNYHVVLQEIKSALNSRHAIRTAKERAEFNEYVAGLDEYVSGFSGHKRRRLDELVSLLRSGTEDSAREALTETERQ